MNTMRTFAIAWLAIALVSKPALLSGQDQARSAESSPHRVTLEEALALFNANNLELRLAREYAVETAGLARQAAAYPNPMASASHEPLSSDDASYSESYFNLSQRIEWPSTRSARREAAEQIALAASARLAADSARLAKSLKEAYVEALRAERTAQVLDRVTGVFRAAERNAQERLQEGDISQYDVRRIAVERARYESGRAAAELEASAARRTLAALAAPESDDLELAPADTLAGPPPTIDASAILAGAIERRREVAAATASLDAARAESAVARRERIPDLTATGGYKRQSDGFSGAFLGLSVPLPLWDRRGGQVEAADARVAAAEARLALTRRQVEGDVRRALETYRTFAERAELLSIDVADDAADLLDIAQVAYEVGEMDLIELLDAANALREAQVLDAQVHADYWTSYFDLERAVGGFTGGTRDMEND